MEIKQKFKGDNFKESDLKGGEVLQKIGGVFDGDYYLVTKNGKSEPNTEYRLHNLNTGLVWSEKSIFGSKHISNFRMIKGYFTVEG